MSRALPRPVGRIVFALALLAACLAPGAASHAARGSSAADRAESCIEYINLTVKKADDRMFQQGDATTLKIQKLVAKGASDEAITRVAMRGKRKIDAIAAECSQNIEVRAGQCIKFLNDRGDGDGGGSSNQELLEEVVKSKSSGLGKIAQTEQSEKDLINKALDDALSGEA